MSEPEATDESEQSLRRVRKFYQIAAEREWQRLEQPNDGALEFAVTRHGSESSFPPHRPAYSTSAVDPGATHSGSPASVIASRSLIFRPTS